MDFAKLDAELAELHAERWARRNSRDSESIINRIKEIEEIFYAEHMKNKKNRRS